MQVVSREDAAYPARLTELRDAPEALWVRGALPVAQAAPVVAIVGARAASGMAMDAAERLAAAVAAAGGVVVSGGAIGIDAAAHRGALRAGAASVSVLAGGVDCPSPARNRALFAAIAERGALVSPYRPGTPPRRWQFVRRNRIIAGLADAVVVLDAQVASGSLYTALAARGLGRVVAAMPGAPGCEALIAQGAAVVAEPADLFAALEGRPRQPDVALPAPDTDSGRVLRALGDAAADLEALSAATGLTARAVTRALTELELGGMALLVPGHSYVRSNLAAALFGASEAA